MLTPTTPNFNCNSPPFLIKIKRRAKNIYILRFRWEYRPALKNYRRWVRGIKVCDSIALARDIGTTDGHASCAHGDGNSLQLNWPSRSHWQKKSLRGGHFQLIRAIHKMVQRAYQHDDIHEHGIKIWTAAFLHMTYFINKRNHKCYKFYMWAKENTCMDRRSKNWIKSASIVLF